MRRSLTLSDHGAEPLYTVSEVAGLMRCCQKTVRRELDSHRLGFIRVRGNVRIPRTEYERYVATYTVKGA